MHKFQSSARLQKDSLQRGERSVVLVAEMRYQITNLTSQKHVLNLHLSQFFRNSFYMQWNRALTRNFIHNLMQILFKNEKLV